MGQFALPYLPTKFKAFQKRFLKELRVSKTKSAKTDISKFKYCYMWGERIDGTPLSDTLFERIDQRIARCKVSLKITAGRFIRYYAIKTVPNEIRDVIEKSEVLGIFKKMKWDALSDEAKQQKITQSIETLSKYGGFQMFGQVK